MSERNGVLKEELQKRLTTRTKHTNCLPRKSQDANPRLEVARTGFSRIGTASVGEAYYPGPAVVDEGNMLSDTVDRQEGEASV